MPSLPTSVALTTIPDGSLAVAADPRNNFAALQSALNSLITILGGGTSPQVLTSGGAGVVSWAAPAASTIYRKTTAKVVNTTVAEIDLLNGEITIGAAALGTTGVLRLTARGDYLQNSGVTIAGPRFKLKLGATTIFDTGVTPQTVVNSATRYGWRIDAVIANTGVANAQSASIDGLVTAAFTNGGGAALATLTTGEGVYTQPGAGVNYATLFGWNSAAVDTSAGQALVLTVILGNAHASHEIVLKNALVEVV